MFILLPWLQAMPRLEAAVASPGDLAAVDGVLQAVPHLAAAAASHVPAPEASAKNQLHTAFLLAIASCLPSSLQKPSPGCPGPMGPFRRTSRAQERRGQCAQMSSKHL